MFNCASRNKSCAIVGDNTFSKHNLSKFAFLPHASCDTKHHDIRGSQLSQEHGSNRSRVNVACPRKTRDHTTCGLSAPLGDGSLPYVNAILCGHMLGIGSYP
ncbi:hypothetical protein D3C81_1765840 [compost metagenome]